MNDDWLDVLDKRCRASSQAQVARDLGLSASTINQVTKGTYKADTARIEQLVRGKYMAETVRCPVIGLIGRDDCARNQRHKGIATNPNRARLARTCPTCIHALGAAHAEP